VARAIADADALISVAHFKGHPAGGYGGALKNIGVGGASKGWNKIKMAIIDRIST